MVRLLRHEGLACRQLDRDRREAGLLDRATAAALEPLDLAGERLDPALDVVGLLLRAQVG